MHRIKQSNLPEFHMNQSSSVSLLALALEHHSTSPTYGMAAPFVESFLPPPREDAQHRTHRAPIRLIQPQQLPSFYLYNQQTSAEIRTSIHTVRCGDGSLLERAVLCLYSDWTSSWQQQHLPITFISGAWQWFLTLIDAFNIAIFLFILKNYSKATSVEFSRIFRMELWKRILIFLNTESFSTKSSIFAGIF